MTKFKTKVIGILCTMFYEDLIFTIHYSKIGWNWGQIFDHTKYGLFNLKKNIFLIRCFKVIPCCLLRDWISNHGYTPSTRVFDLTRFNIYTTWCYYIFKKCNFDYQIHFRNFKKRKHQKAKLFVLMLSKLSSILPIHTQRFQNLDNHFCISFNTRIMIWF